MLTALTNEKKLINLITDRPVKGGDYFCPACHTRVLLKQGKMVRAHFAHMRLKECHDAYENESYQHLELKSSLYRWLQADTTVQIEAVLSEFGQIADLLVGDKLALEVQCSSLSIQRLQERTKAYYRHGFQVLWLLGEKLWVRDRLTSLQKQFLRFSQNMGFHLWELDLERQLLRLRYLIHEDWLGKVQYLTKSYPFGVGNLLTIFREPYARQALHFFDGKLDPKLTQYIAQQLYFQNPKWMELQRQAYEQGENLLTKSLDEFYPQVFPPTSTIGFAQIPADLSLYYESFADYYQKQKAREVQRLYSPAFYQKSHLV